MIGTYFWSQKCFKAACKAGRWDGNTGSKHSKGGNISMGRAGATVVSAQQLIQPTRRLQTNGCGQHIARNLLQTYGEVRNANVWQVVKHRTTYWKGSAGMADSCWRCWSREDKLPSQGQLAGNPHQTTAARGQVDSWFRGMQISMDSERLPYNMKN